MKRAKPFGFAIVGVALFMVLGGPAPGSVGDCSADSNTADPTEHCRNAGTYRCARRFARGDIDDAEQQACVDMVVASCPGTNWPPGCAPTQQAATACIAELAVNPGPNGVCAPDNCGPGEPCMACDNPPACANICAGSSMALTSGPNDAGPAGSDAEVMP